MHIKHAHSICKKRTCIHNICKSSMSKNDLELLKMTKAHKIK